MRSQHFYMITYCSWSCLDFSARRTARACVCVCMCVHNQPGVVIKHYGPKSFDFGKKKAFPMRPQHCYTSICSLM